MSWWRDNFAENPMMVEITRFRRKFFGSGGTAVNSVIVAMAMLIYVGILTLVWTYRKEANPMYLIYLQTLLFTLLGPSMLHAAIAGERERRSWDFLLVAPVTRGQIVTGKFMGAGAALLLIAGFLLIPILIGAVGYEQNNRFGAAPTWEKSLTYAWNLLLAEGVSVAWGFVAAASTLFFSARCRRGFVALGTVLASLVVFLIVIPILTAFAGFIDQESGILNFFHPFWTLAQIESANRVSADSILWERIYGVPQLGAYIGLAVFFLVWTERTLRFADGDVQFLPKHKDA